MIFISTPYSHKYKEVTDKRMKMVAYYAAHLLMDMGLVPISPVLLGDRIRQEVNLPGDFDTWNDLCYSFMRVSKEMHILLLDGWMDSKGVAGEIDFARENNIPIKYIECFQPVTDGAYHFRENEKMRSKERMYHTLKEVKRKIVDNNEDDDVKLRFT